MLQRRIQSLISDRLTLFPTVVLVGPRQCGKTTLARSLGGIYLDCQLSAWLGMIDGWQH